MPPQSYQQVGADLTDNVANFAQSTFSTFSNFLQKPEKLASGKETINEVDLGCWISGSFFLALSRQFFKWKHHYLSKNFAMFYSNDDVFNQYNLFLNKEGVIW